jgi:hypothetical protein
MGLALYVTGFHRLQVFLFHSRSREKARTASNPSRPGHKPTRTAVTTLAWSGHLSMNVPEVSVAVITALPKANFRVLVAAALRRTVSISWHG